MTNTKIICGLACWFLSISLSCWADSPEYVARISSTSLAKLCGKPPQEVTNLGLTDQCKRVKSQKLRGFKPLKSLDFENPRIDIVLSTINPKLRDLLIDDSVPVLIGSVGTSQIVDGYAFDEIGNNANEFDSKCAAAAIVARRSYLGAVQYDLDCLAPISQIEKEFTDVGLGDVLVTFLQKELTSSGRQLKPFCMGVRLDEVRVLTAKHCFYTSTGQAFSYTRQLVKQPYSLPVVARFMTAKLRDTDYQVHISALTNGGWEYARGDWLIVSISPGPMNAIAVPEHDFKGRGPVWVGNNQSVETKDQLLLIGPHTVLTS